MRLRQAADKRIDLIAFGAATPADVDTLAARLGSDGVRLVSEPGTVATPGGGYGFRFFDNEGRTDRGLRRRRAATAPQDRGGRVDPGAPVPRRDQLGGPGGHRRVLRAPPRFRPLRHPHPPPHGPHDVVHAVQLLAPQLRDRPLPAPVAAPRELRAARHRRVHARHRTAAARRRREDLGTRPAPGRRQHLQLLPRPAGQHRRVHDRAASASTRTPGTRACTTSPTRRSPTSGAPPTRWTSSWPASRSTTSTRACSWPRRSERATMRFATVEEPDGSVRCGVVDGETLRRLPAGTTVLDLLRSGTLLAAGAAADDPVPLAGRRLLPPLEAPSVRDFVAFEEHVEGMAAGSGGTVGAEWYEAPTFYFTNPYALVGPHDDVAVPARLPAAGLRAGGGRGDRPRRCRHRPGRGRRAHRRLHDLQRLVGPRPAVPRNAVRARAVQGQGLRHDARARRWSPPTSWRPTATPTASSRSA